LSSGQSDGKKEQATSSDLVCQYSDSLVFFVISNSLKLAISSLSWMINLISVLTQKYPTQRKLTVSRKANRSSSCSLRRSEAKSSSWIGVIYMMFPMFSDRIHSD